MAKKHTGNMGLFIIMAIIYVGILILFAWQTWGFVDWLFPGDQLLMKLLTVLCFDVMALLWACLDLFYHHATRGARTLIRWAWGLSFALSLIASVFYLILESILRFNLPITPGMVNIGYGVTIVAVTETVLFLTFWLYLEWKVRHPHTDDFAYEVEDTEKQQSAQASTPVQQSVTQAKDGDYAEYLLWRKWRDTSDEQEQPSNPLAMPALDPSASQNGNHQ